MIQDRCTLYLCGIDAIRISIHSLRKSFVRAVYASVCDLIRPLVQRHVILSAELVAFVHGKELIFAMSWEFEHELSQIQARMTWMEQSISSVGLPTVQGTAFLERSEQLENL